MGGFLSEVLVHPRIEVDRSRFPFQLPAFLGFQRLALHPQLTFFVGENGSGKSTMLEAIAVNYGLPAEGGTKQHTFSTYDSHSDLHDKIIIGKGDFPRESMFLRAESFYNMATYVDRASREAGRTPRFGWIHQRSHGEGFQDALRTLDPPGVYFMDEPESALSIQGQLILMARLKWLISKGSQLIIATHSPVILGFGLGWIYEFGNEGIQRREYEETASYQLTLDFLRNRGRYADILGKAE